jgi:hypothetical protein
MQRFALILVALAACGDDGGNNPVPDAAIDTNNVDTSPMTPVKVTVKYDGAGRAGVRVHFQGPDSTVISSTMTDTSGEASAVMPAGGFVTAIDPFPDQFANGFYDIRTIAGVKPGDDLEISDRSWSSGTQLTVIGPRDTTAGVSSHYFASPCDSQTDDSNGSGTSPQVTLQHDARCPSPTDFLVASIDNLGEVIHFLFAPNTAVTGSTVDLSSMAITTAATLKTYTLTNVPTALSDVSIEQELSSAKGRLYREDVELTGVVGTHSVPAFTGALDHTSVQADFEHGFYGMADWGTFSTTYTTDVGARLVKAPASFPAFDASTRQITWTETASGRSPDFVFGYAFAERAAADLGISWMITAPYGDGALQFPTLPVENNVELNFQATDSIGVQGLFGLKVPGGYDAARAYIHTDDGLDTIFVNTPSGTADAFLVFARPTNGRPLTKVDNARGTIDRLPRSLFGRRATR